MVIDYYCLARAVQTGSLAVEEQFVIKPPDGRVQSKKIK